MANHIAHFEAAGPEDHKLQSFYRDLFGWTVKPMGPGYSLVETPDGSPDGAVREAETPGLTLGVSVPILDDAVQHAVRLGGTVVMPPTDNGYVNKAQVSDPAGNLISLIEQD